MLCSQLLGSPPPYPARSIGCAADRAAMVSHTCFELRDALHEGTRGAGVRTRYARPNRSTWTTRCGAALTLGGGDAATLRRPGQDVNRSPMGRWDLRWDEGTAEFKGRLPGLRYPYAGTHGGEHEPGLVVGDGGVGPSG